MKKRSGDSSRLGDVSEMLMQKPPLGTPLNWDNPLNDGCVMHLATNEGHGDKVQDISLNTNHGTLNNFAFPPTVNSGWNPGQTGIGLKFDGTDKNIDCGNNKSLDIVSALTISCIVKTTSVANQVIIGKNHVSSYYINTAANTISFWTNGGNLATPADGISDGEFHIVTAVMSGADKKVYVDGMEKVSGVGTLSTDTDHLFVGRSATVANHFSGHIDQPRIMNRAWSAKEVKDYAMNPWQVYLQP